MLAPGEGSPTGVPSDAAGLGPRTYLSLLDMQSNDPLTPHLRFPVTLTVQPRPLPWHLHLSLVVRVSRFECSP